VLLFSRKLIIWCNKSHKAKISWAYHLVGLMKMSQIALYFKNHHRLPQSDKLLRWINLKMSSKTSYLQSRRNQLSRCHHLLRNKRRKVKRSWLSLLRKRRSLRMNLNRKSQCESQKPRNKQKNIKLLNILMRMVTLLTNKKTLMILTAASPPWKPLK